MSETTLPPYYMFIEPLLRVMADHADGIAARDARELVADRMRLSEEERALTIPSGKGAVYRNRCGWAHDRLKRCGYSSSVRRGLWQLTQAGVALAAQHPSGLPEELVLEMHRTAHDVRLSPEPKESGEKRGASVGSPSVAASVATPDEQLEEALGAIRDSVRAELLRLVMEVDPGRFEQLVLDVLHEMGYGLNRDQVARTPISQDGGIDGVISLDRLGLEKVYVQAKRWQDNVGRPQIQAFFGALAGRRATKGVVITTSGFTKDAREYATRVSDSIVLVDGAKLADLMIEYGVGVSSVTRQVPAVDSDYFNED
ncbi:MAG: restriction endonuclease [Planctomycetes bacterium]|nr:restriction endonuclease [Planctomycetota bacterium]